jgi:polar amino acid transport system substrate-binding protein
MVERWMNKSLQEMPEIISRETDGELRAGIVSDLGMPFSLIKDGQLIGFDIELSKRFAKYLNKKYVPVDMPFGSLLASVSTNKIDLITSSLMITEERKKQIDFSDPYFNSGATIIAKKEKITPKNTAKLNVLEDIGDKRVGIFTGTVHDAFMEKKYPNASVFRFESSADMMMSLKTGKVDAAMFDLITARLIMKHNPEFGLLSDQVLDMPLGVGFNKNNPELLKDFNLFLTEVRQDGTYKKMEKRWFEEDAEEAKMPVFPEINSGKKIKAGVSVEDLPYVAVMNGEFVGFDIEMLKTFAQKRNYQLEIITMEFPSLVAALAAGKVDMITDGIAISEERAKEINFSDPYAIFRTAVIAPKTSLPGYVNTGIEEKQVSFFQKVSQSFYNNIILEKRYLLIINGLFITIIISIFAAVFGSLMGGLICFMRMSKNKILSLIAGLYISLLRGTPVLVLLMIIYYVVFASVNINPVVVAIIAFGLNFAAYVSEMFRTSIGSVEKGQWEAGIAGGFTRVQTFKNIIMPQALRHVLPVYKGEFISLVKMTSIVGYIAVQDLTKAGDIIRSRTFDAFFPLIMAAVIYLFIAWLLTRALDYIEVSADPKRKSSKRIQEVSA